MSETKDNVGFKCYQFKDGTPIVSTSDCFILEGQKAYCFNLHNLHTVPPPPAKKTFIQLVKGFKRRICLAWDILIYGEDILD